MKKIAIIPGHSKQRPGAYCKYFQFYEWEWAKRLCSEISLLMAHQNKIKIDQHLRIETGKGSVDSIRKLCVEKLNPQRYDLVLEFHCNSHENHTANGHEVLVWHKTKEDNLVMANHFDTIQGRSFGTRPRRQPGYLPISTWRTPEGKLDGERGWPLLVYCNAPVILLEPGFLSNHDDAKSLLENRGRFALEIAQFLSKFGG
jgi:hypothetical protein